MKYAVIKTGGKQYKVTEGQVIEVEKVTVDGTSYVFEEVLLVVDGDNVQIGTPTVAGMKVYADVVGDVKGDKIEVFKYKSKSRYRKHTGHRQKYTQVKINGIGAKKAAVEPKKVVKTPKTQEGEVVAAPKAVKAAKPAVKKTVAKKPAVKKAPAKKAAK
jgi:large subunit ribosomal protein L21